MNEQRKKMIISEIKYWKKNNLLPAHYCDFLITLYAQGDEDYETEEKKAPSVLKREKRKFIGKVVMLLLLSTIVGVSLFVFTNYPVVTFGLCAFLIAVFLFLAMRSTVKKSAIIPILYVSSAFILLMMSLNLWITFFEGESTLLIALLLLNCALWLFAGKMLKLLFFTISGAVGILLVIAFIFVQI